MAHHDGRPHLRHHQDPVRRGLLPSDSSRFTTNFANLARGEHRQQNLRNALSLINGRLNELADAAASSAASSATGARYRVELDIVSVSMEFVDEGAAERFPLLEMLDVTIVDQHTGERHQGILGNNFSSYLRDYDFSVLLPSSQGLPSDFGVLHGVLFSGSSRRRRSRTGSTPSPSSASASRRARPTGRPGSSTRSSAPSTTTSTPRSPTTTSAAWACVSGTSSPPSLGPARVLLARGPHR